MLCNKMDNPLFFITETKSTDLYNFVLDPLSVIIKLAIINNKSIGTKIHIDNHIMTFQDPGPFQGLCRLMLKTNKTDVQFLYNPIETACKTYLSEKYTTMYPKMIYLFQSATKGLEKLKETYKYSNITCLCFNYFIIIINWYLDNIKPSNMKKSEGVKSKGVESEGVEKVDTSSIFLKDNMTVFYTDEFIRITTTEWKEDKIKLLLNMIYYLINNPSQDTKSLETMMESVDILIKQIL